VVFLFYPRFLAISYDEEFAVSRGVPVKILYYLLVVMIAMVVVFLIRVVGLLLVIALLTIPTYMAEAWCRSLKSMMFVSSLLCAFFTIAGLMMSYAFNLTSGASIICVAGIFFFASLFLKPFFPARTG
jgi:zinc transport system permease protein